MKIRSEFKLCMLGLTVPALAMGPDIPKVERYSRMTNWAMSRLSSSGSLQEFAQQRRVKQEVDGENRYQELFRSAQRAVGIPESDLLPVKMLAQAKSEDSEGYACAEINKILIIPENFDPLPYGAQRITALHESFHHKYHDAVFVPWALYGLGKVSAGNFALVWGGLSLLSSRICTKSLRIAGYVGSPVLAGASTLAVFAWLYRFIDSSKAPTDYDWFKEFRADRDAVSLSKCYQCAQEYDDSTPKERTQYLTQDEMGVFIKKFKAANLLCDHHQK